MAVLQGAGRQRDVKIGHTPRSLSLIQVNARSSKSGMLQLAHTRCDIRNQIAQESIMVFVRRISAFVIVVGTVVSLGGVSHAAVSTNPSAFIDGLASQTLKILDQRLPAPEREARFKGLLLENFDMPRISRFVLGRYWLTASAQEKEEFQKLLPNYVARSYSNRFANYSGETLKVTGSRPAGESTTVVRSRIDSPSGGAPINVEWRVVQTGNDFRIVDVVVDGVSLILTHRDEFAAVIQREGGGVSTLNRSLRGKSLTVAAGTLPTLNPRPAKPG